MFGKGGGAVVDSSPTVQNQTVIEGLWRLLVLEPCAKNCKGHRWMPCSNVFICSKKHVSWIFVHILAKLFISP